MPIRLVMRIYYMLAGAVLLLPTLVYAKDDMRQQFIACHKQATDTTRLQCYDKAVKRYFLYDFGGSGAYRTAIFDRPQPFRIKYENNDIIFVIYVYRADGELIKSYGTGPGTGTLDIAHQGQFYIEVKATGEWRLWLDDLPV